MVLVGVSVFYLYQGVAVLRWEKKVKTTHAHAVVDACLLMSCDRGSLSFFTCFGIVVASLSSPQQLPPSGAFLFVFPFGSDVGYARFASTYPLYYCWTTTHTCRQLPTDHAAEEEESQSKHKTLLPVTHVP